MSGPGSEIQCKANNECSTMVPLWKVFSDYAFQSWTGFSKLGLEGG